LQGISSLKLFKALENGLHGGRAIKRLPIQRIAGDQLFKAL
jgi:hypothetical protein